MISALGRCGFQAVRCATALGLAGILGGCSTVSYLWDVEAQTESVTVMAAPNANNGFPVAVDLVAVEEKAFAEVLEATPAEVWFQKRREFLANNADVANVNAYEIVPGQTIDGISYSWTDRRAYKAIFVYAAYVTPGTHRGRLEAYATPKVILGPDGLRIEKGE